MKIGVAGCSGRMGRIIAKHVIENDECEFVGGTVHPESSRLGADIGELLGLGKIGIKTISDPEPIFEKAEVVIDFTVPNVTINHLNLAQQTNTAMVIGTTGLGKDQREMLINISQNIPIVFSPNMSVGIALLTKFVEDMASRLDEDFDIEIFEMHHRNKADTPSGTAIALGKAAADGRGVTMEETAIRCRTGGRSPGEIGFSVARGGDVPGDHKVMFASDFEVLELSHRAISRGIFASGAVKAALWLGKQNSGVYSMKDVLGI